MGQFLREGMVAGWITEIENPAGPPSVDPVGGGTTGGALAPGAYFLRHTFVDAEGGETLAGDAFGPFVVAAGNIPRVSADRPQGARGFNVYLTPPGSPQGTEMLYLDGIEAVEADLVLPASGGPAPPSRNTSSAHFVFGDQTIAMGYALIAFAAEAKLFADRGLSAAPAEWIILEILREFDKLDGADVLRIWMDNEPGFFLRDNVGLVGDDRHGVPEEAAIQSDFDFGIAAAAMSLDQVVYLLNGWWAVSRWSTHEPSRQLAVSQARRVIDYLSRHGFVIELPGTGEPVARGAEARHASGFLANLAGLVTGDNYMDRHIKLGFLQVPVRAVQDAAVALKAFEDAYFLFVAEADDRHMFLTLLAGEPRWSANHMTLLAVLNRDPWTVLLREAILGDAQAGVGASLAARQLIEAYQTVPPEGPHSQAGNQWAHDNRWQRCTDPPPAPTAVRRRSNGLDFLSMVVLMKLQGLLPDSAAAAE